MVCKVTKIIITTLAMLPAISIISYTVAPLPQVELNARRCTGARSGVLAST
jgi:hypothetical protein